MKTETLKHTPTPWEVHGPVKEGTLDIANGKTSKMRDVGYGIRGIEPKMFGGTLIGIEKGLTKENAAFIVRAVNAYEDLLEIKEAARVLMSINGPFAVARANAEERLKAAIFKAEKS